MSGSDFEQLIAAWLDSRISKSESESLQQQLRGSSGARAMFLEFARLDAGLRSLASGDLDSDGDSNHSSETITSKLKHAPGPLTLNRWNLGAAIWIQVAIAAGALIVVGGLAYQLGKFDTLLGPRQVANDVEIAKGVRPIGVTEKTLSGYATLRRGAGIEWTSGSKSYRAGDVLPAGVLEFDEGVAEIDFFCGATLIVEGPAKLDLESDWSVRLLGGRLRANVPPAARGFVVKAADSEIVDLGTEFALEVGPDSARVKVVDGEVKLKGGQHDGEHLVTGQGQLLLGTDSGQDSFRNLSTIGDVQRRHETEQRERFTQWKAYSQKLRKDDRLIAYYPIAESKVERFVSNVAATGSELDGKLVGLVHRDPGRFGSESTSLGFDRPGSRVRALVDGEFDSLTFACWVKIDSLEHLYNALVMSDGYENGEPHWQIHQDGRLMFSVMIDDTPGSGEGRLPGARLTWVYYTQPIWDMPMTGQWIHVAAVYDPVARQVNQYVNGEKVSGEKITDKYYIETLRIGPAEIGNWGQPFRKSQEFAVRNLNGVIDELAIFGAALNSDEIKNLYEQGKPFGY